MNKEAIRTGLLEQELSRVENRLNIQSTQSVTQHRLTQEESDAFERALKERDGEKAVEILSKVPPSELYFSMPDLSVSDKGSINSIKVYVYSAETKDDILLHKLFSGVRDKT